MAVSKKFFIIILLLLPAFSLLFSDSLETNLRVQPGFSIPFGPVVDGDLQLFSMGGSLSFTGDFFSPAAPFVFGRINTDLEYLPLNGTGNGFTVISAGIGAGPVFRPSSRLSIQASIGGGWYYAISELSNTSNAFFGGGLDIGIALNPSLSLGVGGRYKQLMARSGPLYQGLGIQLGLSYNLSGSRKGSFLEITPEISPIFPLFYTYYDKNPAGVLTIRNNESVRYDGLTVSFFSKQYMDGPRICGAAAFLKPGEEISMPVYALFNDSIFRVTEGTKAAGEIIAEYSVIGKKIYRSFPVTVDIKNRNAMQWDDDRKAAAFITAKDPLVLSFSKHTVSLIRTQNAPPISENFRTALALFQTLSVYRMGYAVDPSTPFTAFSQDQQAIDFLQFPNQTLSYRAGDCDDLSVLFSALLESVGVPTALITTPGHIFVAFDMGIGQDDAKRFFNTERDMIVRGDTVWCPVEVTMVKSGFLKAWRQGIQEWSQALESNQAGFFPVHEAWEKYEPIGFIEAGFAPALPTEEEIESNYKKELFGFYDFLVMPQISRIRENGKSAGWSNAKITNKVGVLYAQLGMLEKSEEVFRTILREENYPPAYNNLANVLYLIGKYEEAAVHYNNALQHNPENPKILSALVSIYYNQGDLKSADKTLERLRTINPRMASSLALRYGDTHDTRASEQPRIGFDDWEEDFDESRN